MNELVPSNKTKLNNSNPAIIKLRAGKWYEVTIDELTHPRIVNFYDQERFLSEQLGKRPYRRFFEKLTMIAQLPDLELQIRNLERELYWKLSGNGSTPQLALEEAHSTAKTARKIWYRMGTNFDEIEELHKKRIEYVQSLGAYLSYEKSIADRINLMLIIKDTAMGTDADGSDIDLAFLFKVDDYATARQLAINAIKPAINDFEIQSASNYPPRPPRTAHIDWENQVYSTKWLFSLLQNPPKSEILYDGQQTRTQTLRYVTENIFGTRNGVPISIPVPQFPDEGLYNEFTTAFDALKVNGSADTIHLPGKNTYGSRVRSTLSLIL